MMGDRVPQPDAHADGSPLVLALAALDRDSLAIAGGKAANLGELILAGFPVPAGFCLTTRAYELVAAGADLEPILERLSRIDQGEVTQDEVTQGEVTSLAELAAAARRALLAAPVPHQVARALLAAYRELGTDVRVAVRSSATAEDLPGASFAGQQETFLNVTGPVALLVAVQRCWASLWTDRAVSYRTTQGIDHRVVRLAVVVQRLVPSAVAGVIFTADPLTGKRRRTLVDASPGLGEAVVSGAVNPDHFVVDSATGVILDRRLGDKRVEVLPDSAGGVERVEGAGRKDEPCLDDEQLRALARLGAHVETHFGRPQDIEWAIDTEGRIWLLQARPITTLFPLPTEPATPEARRSLAFSRPEARRGLAFSGSRELRVYLSVNVVQGFYRPFTPMGLQVFRLLASALATLAGRPPPDHLAGPAVVVEAGQRLFVDATPLLRSRMGRRLAGQVAGLIEARMAGILHQLATDPRLAPPPTRRLPRPSRLRCGLAPLRLMARMRLPLRVARALLRPTSARARAHREARSALQLAAPSDPRGRLAVVEVLLLHRAARIPANVAPVVLGGLGAFALAGRLLGELATPDERQVVLRALPHNPTTQMDLALWSLAQRASRDPLTARALRDTPPDRLAGDYRRGALPPPLQDGLRTFLEAYGHRAVGEIDLGLARWAEDPTHLLSVLAGYLQIEDPAAAPDVRFERAAAASDAMVTELVRRARSEGWIRAAAVRFCFDRTRELAGMREAMKFYLVALLARGRALLWPVGEALVEAGWLQAPEDVFFLTLPEARTALDGRDVRPLVRARRAAYQAELTRRHIPRVLLSDGTEPTGEPATSSADGELRGSGASPGQVTAPARVVLDPAEAQLAPGEVLVAPSTDPGWTPLFLTAGALVMEMGGVMSHGAVVAREYGIPAVVGVAGATQRIRTGQLVTVDGTRGVVHVDDGSSSTS